LIDLKKASKKAPAKVRLMEKVSAEGFSLGPCVRG